MTPACKVTSEQGQGPPRATGMGSKDTGAQGGGHHHPKARGPEGISPRSTPSRAASTTGRKTFMLRAQAPVWVSPHQESTCSLETQLVGAGLGGQGWAAASSSPVFLLPPNLPALGAGLLAETPAQACCCWGRGCSRPAEGTHDHSQKHTEVAAWGPGGGG